MTRYEYRTVQFGSERIERPAEPDSDLARRRSRHVVILTCDDTGEPERVTRMLEDDYDQTYARATRAYLGGLGEQGWRVLQYVENEARWPYGIYELIREWPS